MKYAALLRGINVGGHRKIKMEDLRDLFEKAGCESVRTYLQSGNAVFWSELEKTDLESRLSDAIKNRYGFDVWVLLRPESRINQLLANNPFPQIEGDEFKKLYTIHLDQNIDDARWASLKFPETVDEAICDLDCIYLFCKTGYGKTKIGNLFFEKKLKVQATARNWRTLNAIANMLQEI